jgi:sigma-E factor negative regulatory protein RseC
MSERARVSKVTPGKAWVEMEWNEACATCGSHSSCFGGSPGSKHQIEVIDGLGVQAGETVEIEFPPYFKIGASFLLFGLPIGLMLAGYFFGARFLPGLKGETAGIAGSIVGLAVSICIIILTNKVTNGILRKLPKIIKVLR